MSRPSMATVAAAQLRRVVLRKGREPVPDWVNDLADAAPAPPRLSVSLAPEAIRDLEALKGLLGFSKTDLISRSISVYRFIREALKDGGRLLVEHPDGAVSEIREMDLGGAS